MACSGLAVVEFAALILRSRRCARSLPDVSLLSLDLHRGWLKAARASLRWRLPAFLGLPSSPRRTSPVAHSLLHTRPLLAVWQIEGVSCMQVVGVCDALQRRSSTTHVHVWLPVSSPHSELVALPRCSLSLLCNRVRSSRRAGPCRARQSLGLDSRRVELWRLARRAIWQSSMSAKSVLEHSMPFAVSSSAIEDSRATTRPVTATKHSSHKPRQDTLLWRHSKTTDAHACRIDTPHDTQPRQCLASAHACSNRHKPHGTQPRQCLASPQVCCLTHGTQRPCSTFTVFFPSLFFFPVTRLSHRSRMVTSSPVCASMNETR